MGEFELRLGNDALNPFPLKSGRRFDDDGFTHSTSARLRLGDVRVDVGHMMLTERGGLRRTDEVGAGVTYQRVLAEDGPLRVSSELGVALALSGPLGGMQLQDWMHTHVFRGRHLDGGGDGQLQNIVPDRVRAGLVFSGALSLDYTPVRGLTLGATARGALAAGESGVSSLSADAHARLEIPLTAWLALDAGAALGMHQLDIHDPTLLIPGGYATAPFLAAHLSAGVRVGPVRAGFAVDINQGGSGANLGTVSLGTRF